MNQKNPRPINEVPDHQEIKWIFDFCATKARQIFGCFAENWNVQFQIRAGLPPETVVLRDPPGPVVVFLSERRSRVGYAFEAGHESIHCVNPIFGVIQTNWLEEAVAVAFSFEMVKHLYGQDGVDRCSLTGDYERALELASEIDDDVIRLGQQLRKKAGSLYHVKAEHIMEMYPKIHQPLADNILNLFPRQR